MIVSKALVGPVDIVRFYGGPRLSWCWFEPTGQIIYTVPRDTLDPRYAQCVNHRVACDCREAELAEHISELLANYEMVRKAIAKIIAGHDTEVCQCTGCRIARETHLTFLSCISQESKY